MNYYFLQLNSNIRLIHLYLFYQGIKKEIIYNISEYIFFWTNQIIALRIIQK